MIMEFHGFAARVDYDPGSNTMRAVTIDTSEPLMFEGPSIDDLRESAERVLAEHLARAAAEGRSAHRQYSGKFLVRVTPELHRAAVQAAERVGMSLNAWVAEALAAKAMRP
jgi:predicted HicB family RNase H-like nuclease